MRINNYSWVVKWNGLQHCVIFEIWIKDRQEVPVIHIMLVFWVEIRQALIVRFSLIVILIWKSSKLRDFEPRWISPLLRSCLWCDNSYNLSSIYCVLYVYLEVTVPVCVKFITGSFCLDTLWFDGKIYFKNDTHKQLLLYL